MTGAGYLPWTQRSRKLDSSRPVGTGVALNGLNGNGGHEVQ
ncbi:hypothetical protein [Desulforapulum autotrophicum]|nr:hypothetical protein [Desulforapulum autotrophicum]